MNGSVGSDRGRNRRLSTICEVRFALSLSPSLPHSLCFESDGVLTEANQRRSFSSSVAEMEKTEEEEDSGEDIGATVVCSCETLANHLTNCGFQSTPRGERVHQSMLISLILLLMLLLFNDDSVCLITYLDLFSIIIRVGIRAADSGDDVTV